VGSPLLPITRWFNATATFSSHFSGNMLETGVDAMMRGVQSGAMMAANFFWWFLFAMSGDDTRLRLRFQEPFAQRLNSTYFRHHQQA